MKLVIYSQPGTYPHVKNYDGLQRMCTLMNINFEHTTDINRTFQDNYEILIAYNQYIDPDRVPKRIKIIYGPGISVFPNKEFVGPLRQDLVGRCVYNTLSEWNKHVYEEMASSLIMPLVTFPYGIEADYFAPTDEQKTNECILYVKSRDNHTIEYVKNILNTKGIQYKIFKYGSYNGNDFKNTLTKTKYMISLDAHESQGFALQEAMSSGVPLLVCDISSMFDEIPDGIKPKYLRKDYPNKKLKATSVPYWSDECGIRINDIFELSQAVDKMRSIHATFTPRQFILRTLSNEICMKRIVDYFFSPKKIVASLTTIPSRIGTCCKEAIDSLINQVDHVYLSVSNYYKRFKTSIDVPEYYYTQSPYKEKLTIVFGEDRGPASKYLGSLSKIPEDCWVFFCDDDQIYHPTLIERILPVLQDENKVYQNRYETFTRWGTSGGLIHGYVGNIVHKSKLKNLIVFEQPECANTIDDQWMSIYYLMNNIEIKSTNIDEYNQIFGKLNPQGYEQWGPDSLVDLGTREKNIQELEKHFKVKFIKYSTVIEKL
jgi:hypothetical protein